MNLISDFINLITYFFIDTIIIFSEER